MTTPQWLSILGTLVGAAIVWGSLKNQVGNLETAFREFKAEVNRSREDQGKRLYELESSAKVQRALTGARGVRLSVKEGDE